MTDRGLDDDLEAATCATRSRALGEPAFGTGSVVPAWLLIEQPGAWPTEALASRPLRSGIGAELARLANRHRVRVVLIRRTGRSARNDAGSSPRRVFVAHVRDSAESTLAHTTVDSIDQILELDFGAIGQGSAAGLEPADEPVFCICTHGAHDQCCAIRGRPVAAALTARYPRESWEISHIGGDRFAANIACFPHGHYFGRVPPHEAVHVVSEYLTGRLRLEYLRGRVSYPMVVQAAEHFLRVDRALDEIRALQWRSRRREPANGIDAIAFDLADGGSAVVRVRTGTAEPARTLTCDSERFARPPSYELIGIE